MSYLFQQYCGFFHPFCIPAAVVGVVLTAIVLTLLLRAGWRYRIRFVARKRLRTMRAVDKRPLWRRLWGRIRFWRLKEPQPPQQEKKDEPKYVNHGFVRVRNDDGSRIFYGSPIGHGPTKTRDDFIDSIIKAMRMNPK